MSNIKIFTSYHKKCELLKNKYIYPIQVGVDVNGVVYENSLHDNTGENISKKNAQYCELTAQYWAWKNENADYYGFFHYRRYLSFNTEKTYTADSWGNVCEPFLSTKLTKKYCWDESSIQNLVEKYDLILPQLKDIRTMPHMGKNMREQYTAEGTLHRRDLDIMLEVIKERYPTFLKYAESYENGHKTYFNNMFCMKKEIFESYSNWLFDILEGCVKRGNYADYSTEALRTPGHLAERLLNIYVLYLKDTKKDLKYTELQTVFFENTETQENLHPVYSEDAVTVALSINDYYVPYAAVVLQSIHDNINSEEKYDIIIMNRDVSAVSQKALRAIFDDTNNVSIRFFNVSRFEKQFENLFLRGHFALETYFRLLLPNIMEGYKKVLYLDSDVVVTTDIAELFRENIDGYLLAACHDADTAGLYNGYEPAKKDYMDNVLKIKRPYQYFQAGVILFNLDEFRKKYTVEEMLKFAASYEWQLLDQDVLNYLAQDSYKPIDMKWNVMTDWNRIRIAKIISRAPKYLQDEYKKAHAAPNIIHYAGPDKPWHQPDSDYSEVFWVYARKTASYEVLIQRLCERTMQDETNRKKFFSWRKLAKGIADPIFPPKSKRREALKRIVRKLGLI